MNDIDPIGPGSTGLGMLNNLKLNNVPEGKICPIVNYILIPFEGSNKVQFLAPTLCP